MGRKLLYAVMVATLGVLVVPATASAQDWADGDPRPLLRDIISIDRHGEPGWPYGSEDLAGDGNRFDPEEASVDVRTVYADADNQRLYLRAYTGSGSDPADTTSLYVFIDADVDDNTGGSADATDIDPVLDDDPTTGGYELVIVAQSDGSVAQVWAWDEARGRFNEVTLQPDELQVLRGVDRDPFDIGINPNRGYIQVDLTHVVSNLTLSCDARLYVRTWDTDLRYGDRDAGGRERCRAVDADNDGTPDIIVDDRQTGCVNDGDCPGDSLCHASGVCLYGYECLDDGDCRSDEACASDNRCVRVVTAQCNDDGDCDGLVCEGGACLPCTQSGARACASDEVCTPLGECVPESSLPPTPSGGDGGFFADPDIEVQGGACTCRQAAGGGAPGGHLPWLVLFAIVSIALVLRRRNQEVSR